MIALERKDNLQSAIFDLQPTPLIAFTSSGTIVLANEASLRLFADQSSGPGSSAYNLPITLVDGSQQSWRILLDTSIGHLLAGDGGLPGQQVTSPPPTRRAEVLVHGSSTGVSKPSHATLSITALPQDSDPFVLCSFELHPETREHSSRRGCYRRSRMSPLASTAGTLSGDGTMASTLDSTSVDESLLDARFAELRDAIYFSDKKAGFLLSADETFAFPNYRGSKNTQPVQIEDINAFFSDWDVWSPDFSAKLPVSDYPSMKLNREREAFQSIRYGSRDSIGGRQVIEASGDPLYSPVNDEYVGGVVWIKTLGTYDEVVAKDLEEELSDFKTICDRLPHLLWTVNNAGQADYFSRAWCEFTGMSEEESMGLGFEAAIHPEDMKRIWATFQLCTKRRETLYSEARYKKADGSWCWMAISAKPVFDADGKLLKWYGTSTDINQLFVTRERANHEKSQMMEMLDHAKVGVFRIDRSLRFSTVMAESLPRMFAFESEVASQIKNSNAAFGSQVRDILQSSTDHAVFEERFRDRWYKFRLIQDVDNSGDSPVTKGVLGCAIDITEAQKRSALEAENTRLQAEKDLEVEKNNLKSSFLAHMSHEIRTPIAGVLGVAEILMDTKLTTEQRGLVDCIQISASNLLAIVNDILDLSKVEAGRMQLESIPFNVDNLVTQVARVVEVKAKSKGLELQYELKLPTAYQIVGDPGRISQVLSNLLSNAIKFTSTGHVSLKVAQEDTKLVFTVTDTGIGMKADTLAKLFRPFVQGDSSTAREYGGTGLGLTISKKLAELMGGSLKLESKEGTGTTAIFTVELKAARRPSSTWQNAMAPKADVKALTINTQTVPKVENHVSVDSSVKADDRLILIVEDNAINQKVALSFVRKSGYQAHAAWNGREALDYLAKADTADGEGGASKLPALVLMDCQMPILDGYETTRRIRSGRDDDRVLSAKVAKMPIVALTASAITGDREKCEESGMDDYLTKPISKVKLQEVLKKWLA